MGALDMIDVKGGNAGLGNPAYAPTGFGDVTGASFKMFPLGGPVIGNAQLDEPFLQRDALIKQKLGRDVYDLTGVNSKYDDMGDIRIRLALYRAKKEDAYSQIDGLIEQGRKENPGLWEGIKTTAEINAEAKATRQAAETNLADKMARNDSTVSRTAGVVVGGVGAALTDPYNILTLPFGAGETRIAGTGAMAVARAITATAAREGLVQAAIQSAQIPEMAQWYHRMGARYGLSEAAQDVGFGFLGGAALRGVGEAVGHSSAFMLDRLATSTALPQTVKDSLRYMSRAAYIDENAPLPIRNREELQAHRTKLDQVNGDVENYRPLQTSPSDTASVSGMPRASGEKTSPGETPSVASTQDLPSQRTMTPDPSSSFETAYIAPSKRNMLDKIGLTDSTSTSIIYHGLRDVNKLIARAEELRPGLEKFLNRMVEGLDGARVYGARTKKKEDLIGKTKRKNRALDTMPDVLGGRIVADTPQEIAAVMDRISHHAKIVEVDDKLNDWEKGYRAVHMIVASDKGISAEIQIQPKEIREVQDYAHEHYYVPWRKYEGQKIPAELMPQFEKDMAASREMFNNAWAKFAERNDVASQNFDVNAYRAKEYIDRPPVPPTEVKPTDRYAAIRSEFDALLKLDPETLVPLDDGTMVKLADYADEIKSSERVLEALTTCMVA